MADRYWVGVDDVWHDADNWSTTSGGAGGAGIPTSADDVFFDANGNGICWPDSDIVCKDLTLEATTSIFFLLDASAVIHGDFSIAAGYFGPTGGPDHTVEFKGNWLNTGGSFSVGTGTGKDPECIFSGTGKTYDLNQVSAASYQHLTVTGEYTFSGTRLGVANISQSLDVSGTLTIDANGATICDVDIDGSSTTVTVTGEIAGTGRLWYNFKDNSVMGTGGTISVKYCKYNLEGTTMTVPARTYEDSCLVEFEYESNNQVLRLGAGRHYFNGGVLLLCDEASVTAAQFDCDTNTAEMYCGGDFIVGASEFPQAALTIKLGDGVHFFRGKISFYFSYTSANTQLVVDAGEGTIVLWPESSGGIVLSIRHRLSRIYSTGEDYITYNKVILFSESFNSRGAQFTEGFGCKEMLVESYQASWSFRRDNLSPQMLYVMDKLKVIGDEISAPRMMSSRSLTPGPAGFQVDEEQKIFGVNLRNINASHGIELEDWNGAVEGTIGSDCVDYQRTVKDISKQWNSLSARTLLSPTPRPDSVVPRFISRNL